MNFVIKGFKFAEYVNIKISSLYVFVFHVKENMFSDAKNNLIDKNWESMAST